MVKPHYAFIYTSILINHSFRRQHLAGAFVIKFNFAKDKHKGFGPDGWHWPYEYLDKSLKYIMIIIGSGNECQDDLISSRSLQYSTLEIKS
jgi:hypothetical protein